MRKLLFFFLFVSSLLSAQVNDNFSDGDFTAAPAWNGDNADFTVAAGQLRSNSTTASYGFYLSTPSSVATNTQWELFVNLQFQTSSANYVDVYLTSDSANLQSATHSGYFVRIGNTTDEISLYRRVSGTNTKIIDGLDGQTNGSNNLIRIKVTRDASNLWTLQRDMSGTGSTYFTEGSVTDATITSSSFFGIFIQQSTATFHLKHFFDDIYVGPIITDTTPPSIVSSTVITSTQLDVLFSENVDLATSQILSNYSADNALGNPSNALRDAGNLSLVHLTFATPFTSALMNTLTVNGVQDQNGNAASGETTTFTYVAPVIAAYKDIIINEIFADPTPQVGLPLTEFVEIYNRSSTAFNLSGWKLTDGTSTATLSSYSLLPNQYLIICTIADTASYSVFGPVMGVTSFPSLTNTGDNIYLKDNTLAFIDSVNYTDDWYRDAAKMGGGWTLELINPNAPAACPVPNNWIASVNTDGGTPGIINSVYSASPDVTSPSIAGITIIDATHITVCYSEAVDASQINVSGNYSLSGGIGIPAGTLANAALTCVDLTLSTAMTASVSYTVSISNMSDCSGNPLSPSTAMFTYTVPAIAAYKDVIITEIMADPTPQVALPLTEFVEIHNRSSNPFNLNGWKLTDGTSTATLSNYNLLPNQYLILCTITDTASYSAFGPVMGVTSFPSLTNGGDNIYLKNAALTMIDSVNYLDDWYRDAVKMDGGWTLELINPNAPAGCPPSNNWIASTNANGGTPGIQNSVFSSAIDVTGPSVSSVAVIDSMHISVCFTEAIDASQIGSVGNYNINSGIGTPVSASANTSFTCVDLTLATALSSAVSYTITFSSMSDCSGNALSPATAAFDYYKVRPFDIVINEIMADPDNTIGLDSIQYEYVELHNRTPYAVNLNNWRYTAGTSTRLLPNVNIAGNGYLVLATTTNAVEMPFAVHALGVVSFPGLTNTGQSLTLRNPAGTVISSVAYSDSWYNDASKSTGGWSLEQIDPNNPCEGMSNWRASNHPNGGTPGAQNSVFASNPDATAPKLVRVSIIANDTIQLFFNEGLDSTSMVNPALYSIDNGIGIPLNAKPVGPDFKSVRLALGTLLSQGITYKVTVNNSAKDCAGNSIGADNSARFAIPQPVAANDVVINELLFNSISGNVDFVEIYNRSAKVIDLKTVTICEYDTLNSIPIFPKIIASEGYLLFPGEYLVLSTSGDLVKNQYNTTDPEAFLDVDALPSMNDDQGAVCLASGFLVVDYFKYHENMQFPLLNVVDGVSLERIDFDRPSNDRTNWHSAAEAVGFATPGYQNSQYNDAGETDNAIEITPEIFSPDEDGNNDVMSINYHFDIPGFVANITIYDSKGRLVRNLARNELLGINGTFSWDGINEEREKARIGIYIIFTEVFDVSGKVKHYKKTCVLAGKLE
jgi:hypothetical protein